MEGVEGSAADAADAEAMAKRLWGDWYHAPSSSSSSSGGGGGGGGGGPPMLTRRKSSDGHARSFVSLVLEPIYKIYAHALGAC